MPKSLREFLACLGYLLRSLFIKVKFPYFYFVTFQTFHSLFERWRVIPMIFCYNNAYKLVSLVVFLQFEFNRDSLDLVKFVVAKAKVSPSVLRNHLSGFVPY